MYNRCNGVSGKVERVAEKGDIKSPSHTLNSAQAHNMPPQQKKGKQPSARPQQGIMEQLGGLIPRTIGNLETEDIILLLILYLMYRDSGDKELLIIMGAMFLF